MIEFLVVCVVIGLGVYFRAWLWHALRTVLHFSWFWWIISHPWKVLFWVSLYLLIGAVWSVIHWWLDETRRVRKFKENYILPRQLDHDDDPTGSRTMRRAMEAAKTTVSYHTGDFARWITLWPISIVLTVLDDPLRRIVNRIIKELKGVYQRITDKVWS